MMRGRGCVGRRWAGLLLVLAWPAFFTAASTQASEPPFQWAPPETFDPNEPGLGLPLLPGLEHTIIHNPLPSNAAVDESGDGQYESLRHGTYNHCLSIALYKNKIIVFWLSHARDEDAPAQRVLAKVGTFNADWSDIDWGGDETLVELAGPPVPVRRHHKKYDPNVITEAAAHGGIKVINGRIYVAGRLAANHGWTNDPKYHGWPGVKPVPASHWSDEQDRKRGFRYAVYHKLGLQFVQQWDIQGNTLKPVSPLYKQRDMIEQVEVTPGRFKRVLKPYAQYTNARPFSEASLMMQEQYCPVE